MQQKYCPPSLILLLACIMTTAVHASEAKPTSPASNTFMWQVKSTTASAYLLGTIYIAENKLLPMPPIIEKTFEKCTKVVIESDVSKEETTSLARKMLVNAFYPEGDDIFQHISRKLSDDVSTAIAKYGMTAENIYRFRPWFLARTMTTNELMLHGIDATQGIDSYFVRKAKDNKAMLDLQSVDESLDALFKWSDEDPERYIKRVLQETEVMSTRLDDIAAAWRRGDAKTVEDILHKPLKDNPKEFAEHFDRFFFQRNAEMTERLVEMLQTEDTYFVIVNASFLIGEKGILKLLERKKYEIVQM